MGITNVTREEILAEIAAAIREAPKTKVENDEFTTQELIEAVGGFEGRIRLYLKEWLAAGEITCRRAGDKNKVYYKLPLDKVLELLAK